MKKKKIEKLGYKYNLDMCRWEYPYKFRLRFDKHGTQIWKILNPTKEYMRTCTDKELYESIK